MKSFSLCLAIALGPLSAAASEAGRDWIRVDPRWNAEFQDLESAFGSHFAAATDGTVFRTTSLTEPWEWIATGSAERLTQLRLVGSELFALGEDGGVFVSPDGVLWETRSSGVSVELFDVLKGGSAYLVVGANGTILTSPDGITWAPQNSQTTRHLYSAVWTGTSYVVGGTHGTILTSSDGAQWTPQVANTLPDISTLSWDGSVIRAYSSYGYLSESSDGVQWTATGRATELEAASNHAIAQGSPGTVIGLEDGMIAFSPDEVTWSDHRTGMRADLVGMTWSGSQFIALSDRGDVATSTDGRRWASIQEGRFPFLATAATSNAETLLFCGSEGEIFSTSDLSSWTTEDSGTNEYLRSALWTGSLFVVTGNNGLILTSPDGIAWTRRVPHARWDFSCSFWTGSEILVGGEDGVLLGSPDGITWTVHHPGEISVMCWDGSRIVAVSERTCLHSPDGVHWTIEGTVPMPIVTTGGTYLETHDILWNGSLYVIVGERGSLYTSPDGTNWLSQDTGTRAHLYQILWNGSRFVARGSDSTVIYSSDAEDWSAVTPDLPDYVSDLTWNGTQFLAPYRDGTLASRDGVAWTPDDDFRVEDAQLVAWGDGTYVALGADGFNATSPDGLNWSGHPRVGQHDFHELCWTGTRFLAAAGLEILSSPDGTAWSETTYGGTDQLDSGVRQFIQAGTKTLALLGNDDLLGISDGSDWRVEVRRGLDDDIGAIASGGGKLIASVGNDVATSTDGISWQRHPTSFSGHHQITWAGSKFVALTGTTLLESPDGVAWTVIDEVGLGGLPRALAWNGARLVAFAPSNGDPTTGGVFLSDNGISWTQVHSLSGDGLGFALLQAGDTMVTVGNILLYSRDRGLTWTGDVTRTADLDFADVTASEDLYVAVGASGTIATSTDLLRWTRQPVDTTLHFRRVVWTGQQFIAYGTQRAMSSLDGLTWSEESMPSGFVLEDAHWSHSEVLAVGHSSFHRSPDGLNWATVETGISALRAVSSSDDLIVVGGRNGALGYSSDGNSWTRVPSANYQDVAWNGSQYLAVGERNSVFTSLDGDRWEVVREGRSPDPTLTSVVWTGERFIAVGNQARAETSEDGRTWVQHNTRSSDSFQDVVWTGSMAVAVGTNGRVVSSPAGTTWSPQPTAVNNDLHAVASSHRLLVAVGERGTIQTSTDGSTWRLQTSGTTHDLNDVTWTSRGFVACGDAGTVLTSPAGVSWTPEDTGTPEASFQAVGSHQETVLLGSAGGHILRSISPGNWTKVHPESAGPVVITKRIRAFCTDGADFLAVGSDGQVLSSTQGIDWKLRQQGIDLANSVNDLCWTGQRFVAVASRSRIFTSSDGKIWSRAPGLSSSFGLFSCAFSGSNLVAIGDSLVVRSDDGTAWQQIPAASPASLHAVAWTGAEYLAVGREGTILLSRSDSAAFTTYLAWADGHGLSGIGRDPLGDPDGDECLNLFEMGFGGDPLRIDAKDPELRGGREGNSIILSLRRPTGVPGLLYSFEVSRNLETWEWSEDLQAVSTVEDLGDGTERLRVQLLDLDRASEPTLYVRIRLDLAP